MQIIVFVIFNLDNYCLILNLILLQYGIMREERVTLSNVDIERLIKFAKDHLRELGLTIINEDSFEGYHSIKAHKGGKLALVVGNVRDVELLITGTEKNYEMRLRTGAWGRDIVVPGILGGAIVRAGVAAAPATAAKTGAALIGGAAAVTGAGIAAGASVVGAPVAAGAAVALVEAYRAGKFEKNFWNWLNHEIVVIGKDTTMSKPQVVMPQAGK